jgi:hypothetical protein
MGLIWSSLTLLKNAYNGNPTKESPQEKPSSIYGSIVTLEILIQQPLNAIDTILVIHNSTTAAIIEYLSPLKQ